MYLQNQKHLSFYEQTVKIDEKKSLSKTSHNKSIITDFEGGIPKYKNKYHNL